MYPNTAPIVRRWDVPPAGEKQSFFVRKYHISYSKVWLATYLVRPSINVLLDQGMVKGNRQYRTQASESELQTGQSASRQCSHS